EQHDPGGDELFAERSDLEDRLGPGRNAILDVGETVRFGLHHRAILDDRDRHGWHMLFLHPCPDHRVDILGESRTNRDHDPHQHDVWAEPRYHRIPPWSIDL